MYLKKEKRKVEVVSEVDVLFVTVQCDRCGKIEELEDKEPDDYLYQSITYVNGWAVVIAESKNHDRDNINICPDCTKSFFEEYTKFHKLDD